MASPPRSFVIGETVVLSTRISSPGTKKPVDPATVTLSLLSRAGTPVTVSPTGFTRLGTGDYSFSLQTDGLAAGTYDVTVTVADGPSSVVILTDRFVLQNP